jgi:hypothetical protein
MINGAKNLSFSNSSFTNNKNIGYLKIYRDFNQDQINYKLKITNF